MKLEDLTIYNLSMDLSDKIWFIVDKWTYFQLDTIGKQWVRAVDSVSLNIGEGFGRNTFKDQKIFIIIQEGRCMKAKLVLRKQKEEI